MGSSAIGQGRVQATALQMATVAAAIGLRGRRPHLTLDYDAAHGRAADTVRATSPKVARTIERLMLAVVRGGTGVRAAIPGVLVAGKTDSAELRSAKKCVPDPAQPESCPPEGQANDPTDTDAWFAAYAPAGRGTPHVAVGVCWSLRSRRRHRGARGARRHARGPEGHRLASASGSSSSAARAGQEGSSSTMRTAGSKRSSSDGWRSSASSRAPPT